jgi:hypothetical protein
MIRVEGYITVDAADYSDDLAIVADADEIIEIMDANNLSIEDLIDACGYEPEKKPVEMVDVVHYFTETSDSFTELTHLVRMICHRIDKLAQDEAESKVTQSGVIQMEGARV